MAACGANDGSSRGSSQGGVPRFNRRVGQLLLGFWQKDGEKQECDEPLGRKARKPRRAAKLIDNQARKCWTQRSTDTHYRTKHPLTKIEASSTHRYIGDDHWRHYTEHRPSDNVQQLDRDHRKRITDQRKEHCAYRQSGEPDEQQRLAAMFFGRASNPRRY